jgi:hypothetical protein
MVERALAKDPRARPSSPELLSAVATPSGHEDPLTAATAFLDHTWAMPPVPDDPAWEHARRRPSPWRTYLLGGGVAAVTAAVGAGLLVFLAHAGSGQDSPRAERSSAPESSAPEPSAPASSAAAPTATGLSGSRVRDNSGLTARIRRRDDLPR